MRAKAHFVIYFYSPQAKSWGYLIVP